MIADRQSLSKILELQHNIADRESAMSLQGYLDHIVINSSPEPRLFKDVRQPWQGELYGQLDRAIESLAGIGPNYTGPRKFWYTLPRGHDKTSSIARRCNWLLGYSKRRLYMATGAADYDQAALIPEMMEAELNLNPWLQRRVKVHRIRAFGNGGVLKILNSDTGSTWGLNCDLVIIDELTWWANRELFSVLLSGNAKRHGVMVILTNAGIQGTWQHEVFQEFKTQPDQWAVYEAPEGQRLATWMSEVEIAADRRSLPVGLAKRVYDNKWIDPGEESGFLVRQDIETCEYLGQTLGLTRTEVGRHGVDYVAGIDYGPKRDRTVLCVVHHAPDRRIRVDDLTVWQGGVDSPVPLTKVEEWITDINRRFSRPLLVCDPYQLEGTMQKFEYEQRVERFEARGGKANYEMAANLRNLIVNKRLVWYPGAGDLGVPDRDGNVQVETFKDELTRLHFKVMPYGYRFDHEAKFHDDRTVAVGMAALFAARNPPAPEWIKPPEVSQEAVANRQFILPEQQRSVTHFRGYLGIEDREER